MADRLTNRKLDMYKIINILIYRLNKKEKGGFFMFKSIKSKLITSFLISISICIIAMSLIISQVVGNTIENDFLTSTENEMNKIEEIVNVFFSEMKYNANMLSESDAVKRADDSITSYVNANDPSGETVLTQEANGGVEAEIYNTYGNFVEAHPNVGDVCFGITGGSYVQYAEGAVKNEYDPRARDWYKIAMENPDEVTLTDAYYWAAADDVNVGIVKTIKDVNEQIVGAQSIEVPLSGLTNMISDLKVGENGYVILIEGTGNILSHPAQPELNFENISDTYLNNLADKAEGSVEFNEGGEDYITNIHTSEDNRWKYISVVPKSELVQKTRVVNLFILGLGLIILIISVVVSILISNGISRPIQSIRDLMAQVEVGKFNVKSDIKGKDEVAQLSNSFNNMTENIKSLIQSSQNISVDITDSTDILNDMSDQVSYSAEEITQAISALASDTYEQARQTDGIVESIEQITSEIEVVSNTIGEKTDAAKDLATTGIETVSHLEDVTNKTVESSLQVSNAVDILNEKSANIEDIINMIKHISEETSLLALNASIEAARAGEFGQGFAVVASEIGKLAEESKKSTADIESIILEIQEEIEKAVVAMAESNGLIEENERIVDHSQAAFTNIVNRIDEIKEETLVLNSSLEKMDYEKDQTAEAIYRISTSSEQAAATSEEITASSEEQTASIYKMTEAIKNLRDLSNKLKNSITKFNI